jgi:hypothetical protein
LHITRVGFGSWAVGGGGWLFGWVRNFTNHFSADDAARCGIAKRTACCATWGRRSGMALEAIAYRAAPVRPTACRDPVVEFDTFIVDGLYGGGHESL